MSGDDVKAPAGVAEATGEVLNVETEVAARGRGPKYAGPVDEVRTVVVVTVPTPGTPTPEPAG